MVACGPAIMFRWLRVRTNNVMKLSPAMVARIEAGEILMFAEWRQAQIDSVRLRDKVSGATRSSCVVRHGLETAKEQVSLAEWLPDGTDPKAVKLPWQKGQSVIVSVTSLSRERGLLTVGGRIEVDGNGK